MENTIQRQLQDVQLNILREIDRVCREHNLTYWLAFGTAIGAVRHKGFIPWDDDVDLFMTAEDLEELEKYQSSFSPNYFIQSRRTDPEYGLMITRVRDSNTTLIENEEADRDINHGVFVDIYPLFNCPDDEKEYKTFYRKSLLARLLQYGRTPQTHGRVMKMGANVLLHLYSAKRRARKVEEIYQYMKAYKETGYLTDAFEVGYMAKYPKSSLFPAEWVDFEDMKVPIPGQIDPVLRPVYGDYMQLPPEEERKVHHDYKVVDCDHSYLDYKGKQYCVGDNR